MKPGIYSSEFWLTLVAIVLNAVAASGLVGETSTVGAIIGGAITLLAVLGYTASRTRLKEQEPQWLKKQESSELKDL